MTRRLAAALTHVRSNQDTQNSSSATHAAALRRWPSLMMLLLTWIVGQECTPAGRLGR